MGQYWSDTLNTNQSVTCNSYALGILAHDVRQSQNPSLVQVILDGIITATLNGIMNNINVQNDELYGKRTPSKSAFNIASTTAVEDFSTLPKKNYP